MVGVCAHSKFRITLFVLAKKIFSTIFAHNNQNALFEFDRKLVPYRPKRRNAVVSVIIILCDRHRRRRPAAAAVAAAAVAARALRALYTRIIQ